jgi:hypothetical protein
MYGLKIKVTAWSFVVVTVSVLALTATVARARPALVAARVPPNQTVRQLIAGKFVEKLRCTQNCRATTNLLLNGTVAKRLGFRGAKPREAYGIALITTRLAKGKWTSVRLSAGTQAKKLLAKSKTSVPLNAVVYVRTTADKPLKGAASWRMTLRR